MAKFRDWFFPEMDRLNIEYRANKDGEICTVAVKGGIYLFSNEDSPTFLVGGLSGFGISEWQFLRDCFLDEYTTEYGGRTYTVKYSHHDEEFQIVIKTFQGEGSLATRETILTVSGPVYQPLAKSFVIEKNPVHPLIDKLQEDFFLMDR